MSHHNSDPVCPACADKLLMAHKDLHDWFIDHIKPNFPTAHISWSFRDQASQEQAYADHKSKLHFPYSAHNKMPALALDLFEILESGEGAWNPAFFASINKYNLDHGIQLKWGAHFRLLGDDDHWQVVEDNAPQITIGPK